MANLMAASLQTTDVGGRMRVEQRRKKKVLKSEHRRLCIAHPLALISSSELYSVLHIVLILLTGNFG
jgi:hypothetical protein